MSKFRLVIVDNAKAQLDNPATQKILSDVVFVKQKNFLRTEPNYVVTDKHDMIGTHYLIYDTTDFLAPKLIFAIRTTFLSRATAHRIDTPLMSIIPKLTLPFQDAFNRFHARHKEIVDCNAWFVDPAYSKKNSGLNLSELGYFLVCTHVMRAGFDNIVGCTNETYGASRWLEPVGKTIKDLIFEHPAVKSPHMMILVENFNLDHFSRVYEENKALVSETFEVLPPQEGGAVLTPFAAYAESLYGAEAVKRRAISSAA